MTVIRIDAEAASSTKSVRQPRGIFQSGLRSSQLFFMARDGADREASAYWLAGYLGLSRCTILTRYRAAAKVLAYFLGDHDRAVLPAGAAKSNRQIALAFVNVVRQQVDQ